MKNLSIETRQIETRQTEKTLTVDAYVRLSRDDNKQNYSSIENQKMIIQQYAKDNHITIRNTYEDDGYSGYSFQRPDFQRMMAQIEHIDIIIAKDLSRIGRHNAKVLLFLEQMEELGKRIILIDDNYDSFYSDDDIIGIKTWDNERHVKNTSRKVKRVKRMEQENGTLICLPPFGYVRHPVNKKLVLVDEEAASIVRLIFDLYLDGYGIRKLGEELTNRGVPTPSLLQKFRSEDSGIPFRRSLALRWSFSMVKEILTNDYYVGTKRTHKRERKKINGIEKKIPKEEQFTFPNHHQPIVDSETFYLVQETLAKRKAVHYRGQVKHINLFSGVLFCSDCGSRLTAINHKNRKDKYYICGTYNKKGKQFCNASHMVLEKILIEAVIQYLKLCINNVTPSLSDLDIAKLQYNKFDANDSIGRLAGEAEVIKQELQVLIAQKIQEITCQPAMEDIINETYSTLQNQKMERLSCITSTLKDLDKEAYVPIKSYGYPPPSPLSILEQVLKEQSLTGKDIAVLIEKVMVDKDGSFAICFKYSFGNITNPDDFLFDNSYPSFFIG